MNSVGSMVQTIRILIATEIEVGQGSIEISEGNQCESGSLHVYS